VNNTIADWSGTEPAGEATRGWQEPQVFQAVTFAIIQLHESEALLVQAITNSDKM
jgi:hypothetical protein